MLSATAFIARHSGLRLRGSTTAGAASAATRVRLPTPPPLLRGRRSVVAFSTHSREELEEVARERYGKPYDTLSTDEKKAVGGVIGGRARQQQLGHKGYQEMGHLGGEARKEQLAHEGYQEMGHLGGEARKEQLAHEGYQEMGRKSGEARREHARGGGGGGGHEEGQSPEHEEGGRRGKHRHEEQ